MEHGTQVSCLDIPATCPRHVFEIKVVGSKIGILNNLDGSQYQGHLAGYDN